MVLDALHRSIGRIDPLGHQTTQVLDAVDAGVGSIDALGNASQVVTDALGRVMAGVDALGALTRTLYDGHGNVAQRVDPDGNLWQYSYDRLNRETVRTDPLGAKVTTSYDDAGRVTQVIDRDSRTITYAYDIANRMTQATWSSGNTLTYTYDNANNLLTAKDQTGTITNAYDALGRMTSTQDVFGLTLTYSYDTADRRTLMQDSKNGVLTSVYDGGNRLTSRQLAGSGVTQARVDLAYSSRNELTGVTRYSDVGGGTLAGTTSYSYDEASRVIAITHKNSAGATLSYYNYALDNANRVTQEAWSSGASSGTHTYGYDTTSQLTNADALTYTYDPNGNRTLVGTFTYQTGTSNRVTNDGVYTYGYDAESNLTSKTKIGGGDTWTYGYDLRNRLTSVVETGTATFQATYTYDVLGRRVLEDRTDNSGSHTTTRFSYDGNQVWAELNTSNVVQARYLYGDGETQVLERTDGSGNVQWLLTDHLGSVRDVANSTVVSGHIEYTAFGAVVPGSTNVGDNRLFTGLYLDQATGIVFADQRTLLVTTGQWMQEDPIWFQAGDANLRRYVGNNATNHVDPSGLQDGPAAVGLAAGGALVGASVPQPPTSANLSWNDFRKVDTGEYAALTAWGMPIQTGEYSWIPQLKSMADGKATVRVSITDPPTLTFKAVFERDRSYVRKDSTDDARLLAHERLHLQIAEYMAIKAKNNAPSLKDLSVMVIVNVKDTRENQQQAYSKAIDDEITRVVREYAKQWKTIGKAVNDKYDADTERGTNREKQAVWASKYKQFADDIASSMGWKK
jgi:RHS repeat-associated protein